MFSWRSGGSRRSQPVAADATAVYIAEYQAMREEINNRLALAHGLVIADLGALGAGISVARSFPFILIALAIVSTLLWLFWLGQVTQMNRIAAYIALELRPRLEEACQCSVLRWESYMRQLTMKQFTASAPDSKHGDQEKIGEIHVSLQGEGIHTSMLLGGATPVLLAVGIFANPHVRLNSFSWQIAAVGCSIALWLYTLSMAISVLRTSTVVNARITNS
jgi:hypothetical protein